MSHNHNPFLLQTKRFFQGLVTLCLGLVMASCSHLNGTRLAPILGKDINLINFSYEIAESLIDTALPPLMPNHPQMPVLVATFVDNNDLTKTSKFGRILQEHISSRLVQLGYTVRELKLTETVNIEPKSGETVLSRELSKISGKHEAQAILAGTISRSNRQLYISARLILPENRNIIATYDQQLYMDDNILAMFGLRSQEDDLVNPIKEPPRSVLNAIFW